MIIKYLAPEETSGGSYSVIIDENNSGKELYKFSETVSTDVKNTTVITHDIGTISLEKGTYTLKIVPETISKSELMKVLEIQFIPVDK